MLNPTYKYQSLSSSFCADTSDNSCQSEIGYLCSIDFLKMTYKYKTFCASQKTRQKIILIETSPSFTSFLKLYCNNCHFSNINPRFEKKSD